MNAMWGEMSEQARYCHHLYHHPHHCRVLCSSVSLEMTNNHTYVSYKSDFAGQSTSSSFWPTMQGLLNWWSISYYDHIWHILNMSSSDGNNVTQQWYPGFPNPASLAVVWNPSRFYQVTNDIDKNWNDNKQPYKLPSLSATWFLGCCC